MKKLPLFLKMLAVTVLCIWTTGAKPPVRYMYPTTLGIEYTGEFRGQLITKAEVHALEQAHILNLCYSPVQYVQLSLGLGMDRFETEQYAMQEFAGKFGISPSGSLTLNSPVLLKEFLRITGGAEIRYLNSSDKHGYRYTGPIISPSAGILLHAGKHFDLEFGARGLVIGGTMEDSTGTESLPFSNTELIRGYFDITAAAPSGAFAQFRFDASPSVSGDFSQGPNEMTLGFRLGVLITPDRETRVLKKKTNEYFPEYGNMKEKQDKMGEELGD